MRATTHFQSQAGVHWQRRGMALLAVLWIVAALSVIATGLVHSLRQETRAMALVRQQVQAQALGDAAMQIALQVLVADRRPLLQAVVQRVDFHDVAMQLRITPLTGLIDLNAAGLPLLRRLFVVAGGLAPDAAQALAQAVLQYRQQRDAKGAQQRFEAAPDLLRVPGIDYDLYARLAPLLTADLRGSGRVNPLAAPVQVLTVLAAGNAAQAHKIAAARDAGQVGVDTSALDANLIDNSTSRRLRLEALVPLADGGMVRVERDVDLDARTPDGEPWHTFRTGTSLQPVDPNPS